MSCSGWTISSIDEHYINTVVYEPTKGSSYVPLPVELQHPQKGLIETLCGICWMGEELFGILLFKSCHQRGKIYNCVI